MITSPRGPETGPVVSVLVFSKDRPLQLDAALRSLKLDCDALDPASVRVLYRTSTPFFASQYRVLANQHADLAFVREQGFKADLMRLVDGSRYVFFVVDDTLFVRQFSVAQAIRALESEPGCLGVSLRLGRNTRYCYTVDKLQQPPAFEGLDSGLLSFDWTQAEHDFGYPLEISSSIYRTEDLLPLLAELEYQNPNTLEAALAARAASFRANLPRLACYQQSVAFSVPANLVQTAWRNRVDGRPELTVEALGRAFNQGQRLDVQRYQGFVANACHQELDFVYVQDLDVPAVSVITRCYKQAQYLPDAAASVVAQTFRDWELIIVDDGSPDDTAKVATELIGRYPGHRIRLLRGPNRGLSGALNAGIEAASGRYILPLDADDKIAPTMLERTVGLLDRDANVAIAYTDLQQFGEGSDLIRAADFNASTLAEANQLNYCSLYRREVWEAVGGHNPNMTWGYEDWDFWIGAVEGGYRARRIAEPLFCYRVRAQGMYSDAVRHDLELRRQMVLNHPQTYRRSERMRRRFGRMFRAAVARLDRGVGQDLAGRSRESQ
ncbi:MAG: glycosyltransferase family 2 protein [Candidatus Limnocylindrales bacterium]